MIKHALSCTACLTLLALAAMATIDERSASQPTAHVLAEPTITPQIRSIACTGTPGPLAIWGKDARPLASGMVDDQHAAIVASAPIGANGGRIIAFGHTGLLESAALGTLDTRNFLVEHLGTPGKKPGALLINSSLGGFLTELGWKVDSNGKSKKPALASALSADSDVGLVVLVGNDITDAQAGVLAAFAEAGGILAMAQTAWAWRQNSAQNFAENPLNIIATRAGIAWTGLYASADKTASAGGLRVLTADEPLAKLLHAETALQVLLDFDAAQTDSGAVSAQPPNAGEPAKPRKKGKVAPGKEIQQAGFTLAAACRAMPIEGNPLHEKLNAARARTNPKLRGGISAATPLSVDQPLARAMVAADVALAERFATEVASSSNVPAAHPSAESFPGSVPADAPRIATTRTIPLATPGWHSLGLYAAAGEPITIRRTTAASGGKGQRPISVQIGCHTDSNWHHYEWKRVPDVTIARELAGEWLTLTSAFGGIVYLTVPDALAAASKGQMMTVEITGAVEAPLFVLGKTNVAEWKSRIRDLPGPWAELATSKVTLSVPASAIRQLDDPEQLMMLWDKVLDSAADLATIPRERTRGERYVADVQISAGYMHSGYPIMTHLDAVDDMTGYDRLIAGSWGLFHELGHNHQQSDWTFEGTVEVTCNLFSLYTLDTVCNVPWTVGHPGMKDRAEKIAKHLGTGAKFERWQNDPFLALQMYAQLVEAFGWSTYKKVFAEYRSLSEGERPKGQQQERDQWMVRFSRAAGKDLGPFFDAWGVPVTAEAKASIARLPGWMPSDWPTAEQLAPAAPKVKPGK